MKRALLWLLCLLLLALTGCTDVNQSNRFVVMPEPEATGTPEITPPPVVQIIDTPTAPPDASDTPAPTGVTDAPEPSQAPPQEPEGSPGGFNG